jgi:hypothetical protein
MPDDDARQVIRLLEDDVRRLEEENSTLRALLLRAQESLSSAYTVLLDIAEALA